MQQWFNSISHCRWARAFTTPIGGSIPQWRNCLTSDLGKSTSVRSMGSSGMCEHGERRAGPQPGIRPLSVADSLRKISCSECNIVNKMCIFGRLRFYFKNQFHKSKVKKELCPSQAQNCFTPSEVLLHSVIKYIEQYSTSPLAHNICVKHASTFNENKPSL